MKALQLRLARIGRSGTALIEFALVAPLLVSLLLSVADLAPTLMVRFKVGTATQAVADLAAQAATMEVIDILNFFAIGGDVMSPFSGTPLIQRVSNIASDGNGGAFVYWSCGESPLSPYAARSVVTSPPSGLISLAKAGKDTSYIVVESQYTYTAPAAFILKSPQVIAINAYTLPRVSTYVGPGSNATKPSAVTSTYSGSAGNLSCNTSN